jgi:2,3-bisphosphoglycerate-independent phosphoglycerate mutase
MGRARAPDARPDSSPHYARQVSVLFVFVDGVGLGVRDPEVNPLARGEWLLSRFAGGEATPLPRGGRSGAADATLGVPGRPQSATGQATLLTGENAPRAMGRHLLGFPSARLRAFIEARSIFRELAGAGRTALFANSYPRAYLQALGLAPGPVPELPGRRRARPAAGVVAWAAAGGRFRTWEEARRGQALTNDLTGVRANRFGAGLPPRTAEEAAGILLRLASDHDLTVFEFFETDEAGHARSMAHAVEVLDRLDRFLRTLVAGLGPADSLVVTSDHGNVEDLRTRNHTLAMVPVLGFGPAAAGVDGVRDLTLVAPLLLGLAGVERRSDEEGRGEAALPGPGDGPSEPADSSG